MAFQRRKQGGGGSKPALSVALSAKQGQGYIKGPSFGLWANEEGGPAYRGTLKDEYMAQVLEFLSNAYEAGIPVSLAVFDNAERGQGGSPAPKKFGGFKKAGGFGAPRKPNPFKPQQDQGGPDEGEPGPEF